MRSHALTDHRKIDRDTAEFLNTVENLDLVYEEPEEEGEVDMCLAMEENNKRMKVEGAITVLRGMGTKEADIVEAIVKQFDNVSPEYVKNLMEPKTA